MPSYRVIANNRQPVALRDMMILPVRTGYIGADRIRKPDPALIPPSAEEAVPDVEETTVYLPVRNGYVSAQVYRPHAVDQDAALPVILYAHGGGFTVGSDFDTAYITRRLARDNSVVVVSTNYRMAPEYPFPTPLNDVADVYARLVREAGRVGGRRRAESSTTARSSRSSAAPICRRRRGPSPSQARSTVIWPDTRRFFSRPARTTPSSIRRGSSHPWLRRQALPPTATGPRGCRTASTFSRVSIPRVTSPSNGAVSSSRSTCPTRERAGAFAYSGGSGILRSHSSGIRCS